MGLVADLQIDNYVASGSYKNFIVPPGIHSAPRADSSLNMGFTLYQGSGGTVTTLQPSSLSGTHTIVGIGSSKNLKVAVDEVCKTFGLTKDDLAEVLNIQSRKTLYNWVNGEAVPRKLTMNRLFDLLMVAKAWRSSGLTVRKEQLKEPILGDRTVFDLLKQPIVDKQLILFAGSRLSFNSKSAERLSDPFA